MNNNDNFFQKARIEKSLSLEEVASSLNVKAKFLKQIEDHDYIEIDDHNLLLYYKRAYAKFLGIDIEVCLEDNNIEHVAMCVQERPSFSLRFTILCVIALSLLLL